MSPNTLYVVTAILVPPVFLGPMLFRMFMPVPPADQVAIELFLKNRSETLNSLKKMWVGGPVRTGSRWPYQSGRPYIVVADGSDAVQYTHGLAVEDNAVGGIALKQRQGGAWLGVLQ